MKYTRISDRVDVPAPLAVVLWFFCAFLVSSLAAVAHGHQPSEFDVKAAYVYNFTKFVDWPSEVFPDDSAPVRIGVFDDIEFVRILKETVQGKTAYGRQLEVIPVNDDTQLTDLHILCFAHDIQDRQVALLDTLRDRPLLTIGECGRFTARGGMINLFMEDNKVRFEINPEATRRAGLTISSHLLKLARIVPESSSAEGR
ncbi:MAG: YfiR family protein [candidate division Zixibacteria bacterium]|nr:YfiR family protein [candidate division Zixibacteria bacterium]